MQLHTSSGADPVLLGLIRGAGRSFLPLRDFTRGLIESIGPTSIGGSGLLKCIGRSGPGRGAFLDGLERRIEGGPLYYCFGALRPARLSSLGYGTLRGL